MANKLNRGLIWLLVVMGGLVCACGYRFPGGGELPGGLKTVAIPLFVNRTNQVGLENIITNDLTNEFIIRRKNALADSNKTADGILKGEIASVYSRTITQTEAGGSVEREVVVVVNIRLIDSASKTIWFKKGLSARETYDLGTNSLEAELNRREAIEELSVRLAEKIYNRLVEDF